MLLETPLAIIEEGDDLDVAGDYTYATPSPPPSLELVAARQKFGPAFTKEVSNEDDEGALDGDQGRFELEGESVLVSTQS
jgi:hypothetical protein